MMLLAAPYRGVRSVRLIQGTSNWQVAMTPRLNSEAVRVLLDTNCECKLEESARRSCVMGGSRGLTVLQCSGGVAGFDTTANGPGFTSVAIHAD